MSPSQEDTCTCWNVYFDICSDAGSPEWWSHSGLIGSSPTWIPHASREHIPIPPHPVRLPVTPQYLVGFQAFSLQLSHSTSNHPESESESHSPKLIKLQFWRVKIIRQAEISLSPMASPPAWTTLSDNTYFCSETKTMQMHFILCKREHSCKSYTKILTSTLIFR